MTGRGERLRDCALAIFVSSFAAAGCNEGSPARPVFVPLPPPVDAGSDSSPYGLCPGDMDASYSSLFTQMFATTGCGTDKVNACHSPSGAQPIDEGGTGSLLDFTLDARAVYEELLGADGGGVVAQNVQGSLEGGLRVVPGDADASLLFIKFAMPGASDPAYGEAMPPDVAPCPQAIDTLQAWINQGAPEN